ncbi:MAG: hypothetical protein WD029_01955 [Microthrixaceae bacterium]
MESLSKALDFIRTTAALARQAAAPLAILSPAALAQAVLSPAVLSPAVLTQGLEALAQVVLTQAAPAPLAQVLEALTQAAPALGAVQVINLSHQHHLNLRQATS